MDHSLFSELRHIELRTKRAISNDMIGQFRTAFRGSGLVFSDLREYTPGDDIRHIHWKVTARTGKPFVKTFDEDRQLNILLAVDISNSTNCGMPKSKHRRALEFAAIVSMLALKNQDSIGLSLFADGAKDFIAPGRSRVQFKRIISKLSLPIELPRATDLRQTIDFISTHQKRPAIIFLISDFYSPAFFDLIPKLSHRHDLIGVLLEDQLDSELLSAGLVQFTDAESGKQITIDSGSERVRSALVRRQEQRRAELKVAFQSHGASLISIRDSVTKPLEELMTQRTVRH